MGQSKNTMGLFIDVYSKLYWSLYNLGLLSVIFSQLHFFHIPMVPWIPVAYFESLLERLHQERPAASAQGHDTTSTLPLLRLCPRAGGSSRMTFGSEVGWASSFLLPPRQPLSSCPHLSLRLLPPPEPKPWLDPVVKGDTEPGQGQRGTLEKTVTGSCYSWHHDNCPCAATRPCTSALTEGCGAWGSSLASPPSGAKMQADIPCRLPPKAAA